MPKESRSRMQKWPSSTSCPPNSTVTGTTHFYPVAIRSAHVICAQALTWGSCGDAVSTLATTGIGWALNCSSQQYLSFVSSTAYPSWQSTLYAQTVANGGGLQPVNLVWTQDQ